MRGPTRRPRSDTSTTPAYENEGIEALRARSHTPLERRRADGIGGGTTRVRRAHHAPVTYAPYVTSSEEADGDEGNGGNGTSVYRWMVHLDYEGVRHLIYVVGITHLSLWATQDMWTGARLGKSGSLSGGVGNVSRLRVVVVRRFFLVRGVWGAVVLVNRRSGLYPCRCYLNKPNY